MRDILNFLGICVLVCVKLMFVSVVLLEFIALFLDNDAKELVCTFGFRIFCSACFVWFLDST